MYGNQWQQPQPTGYGQPQQQQFPQQTGFPGQQQQQLRPQMPQAPGSFSFLNAPPPQSQFNPSPLMAQQTGYPGMGGGSGLRPQQTGFPSLQSQPTGFPSSGLQPQPTGFPGSGGLVPQQTGYPVGAPDPRLGLMSSTFMPMNLSSPYAPGNVPVFQQPNLPASNLSQSMSMMAHNPALSTPKIPWKLTRDEKKNYDSIFRAWDSANTGFISGEVAQGVFGQSGLGRDDLAKIWTLSDVDNRGKLNIQEFHVAMGLIYRALNGNIIPDILPPELVPASARDIDSNVDFMKNLLKNDRSTGIDIEPSLSYAKNRSLHSSSAPAANSRKDGTVYKHDDSRPESKGYTSSNRHIDRSSIRTGRETAQEDLSDIKRQLADTSSYLDQSREEDEGRTREDEKLDDEMRSLRRSIRNIREDLDDIKGRRGEGKEEQRRKLERELLYLSHEKLPELERRIEDRDERKRRADRDGVKARDRRNNRYGGRYEDDDDEEDRGYMKGSYDRDRSRDRDRDRYREDSYREDSYRDESYRSSRDNRGDRSPPPAPPSQSHSLAAAPPPPPVAPVATPPPSRNLTQEQRLAAARERAQQKIADRRRALGLPAEDVEAAPVVDTSVQERLEAERKEAAEQAAKAEKERAERESQRQAKLDEERGARGVPPASASAAPVHSQQSKATPPTPLPKSAMKKPPPAPAPRPGTHKPVPTPAPVPAPALVEEDPEEVAMKEREIRLKKAAEDRKARIAELERQEEEAKKAEEEFEARRSAFNSKPAPTPEPAAPAVVSPPGPVPGGSKHNPFNKLSAGASAGAAASPSSVTSTSGNNPFFKSTSPATESSSVPAAPPPPPAPPAPAPPAQAQASRPSAPVAKKYVPPVSNDDDWDVINEKDDDSDSDDDFQAAKKRKADLARALFGGKSASASPVPSPPPAPSGQSNAALAKLGGGDASPASRGGLFAAIQGGAKLKKAVTNDRSGAPSAGAVVGGDAAPPSHIKDVSETEAVVETPIQAVVHNVSEAAAGMFNSVKTALGVESPAAHDDVEEDVTSQKKDNRQSVDWYGGLASNGGAEHNIADVKPLPSFKEEDESEDEAPEFGTSTSAPTAVPADDVDRTKTLRMRTLYAYAGQRDEDLSFEENQVIIAHPATDPSSPWYHGTTVKGNKSGYFPSSYATEFNTGVKAKALYAYLGGSPEELPFNEGDILSVVEHDDASWWKVEEGGMVYLVPAAYVELEVMKVAPPFSQPSGNYPYLTSKAETEEEESDEEDSDDEAVEGPEEKKQRELERQRVLEAAGFTVTTSSQQQELPPPIVVRRPPPSVPSGSTRRRAASSPSPLEASVTGDEHSAPQKSLPHVPSTIPSPDHSAPSRTPLETTEEDAYDRYVSFLQNERRVTIASPSPSLQPVSFSPSPRPLSLVSNSTLDGPISPQSQSPIPSIASFGETKFSNLFKSSKATSAQEPRKVISGPMTAAPLMSSSDSSTGSAFGSNWSSLVDASALQALTDKERKRQEAMFEFILTEQSYVRDLQNVVQIFYAPLMSEELLSQEELVVIFANIEEILITSTTMLSELEERQKISRLYINSLGDILSSHFKDMAVYLPYCVQHSRAIKTLHRLRTERPQLAEQLSKMRESPEVRNMDLSSYLLSPMQRVTRYPLLLKQILAYTLPEGTDRQEVELALREVEDVLNSINASIRRREEHERLAEISNGLVIGQGKLDLNSATPQGVSRRLLMEGSVVKAKSSKSLLALLCTDIFVLIDPTTKNLYRMPISLMDITLRDSGKEDVILITTAYPRGGEKLKLKPVGGVKECKAWLHAISAATLSLRELEKRNHRRSRSEF